MKSLESYGNKIPPHSNKTEIAVIGALMLDDELFFKIKDFLDRMSFYSEIHRVIYHTMLNMFESKIKIDIITLSEELHKQGKLEFIGGTFYLSEINAQTVTSVNIEYHARILKEKQIKRELIEAASQILISCHEDLTDAFVELERADTSLIKIHNSIPVRQELTPEVLAKNYLEYQKNLAKANESAGLSTGISSLDSLTSFFHDGDYILIAARPSIGKTALLLSIFYNMAIIHHNAVGLISLEMTPIKLLSRLVSMDTGIDNTKFRSGNLNEEERQQMIDFVNRYAKTQLIISDTSIFKASEIELKCRRLKRNYNVKCIGIDYIQLMESKGDNREREIANISNTIRRLTKELNIPIIALAQLNRKVDERSGKEPQLSDLRESGTLEQDADIVLLIHRPEHYRDGAEFFDKEKTISTKGKALIIQAKHRDADTGAIYLNYNKQNTRFYEPDLVHERQAVEYYNESREYPKDW